MAWFAAAAYVAGTIYNAHSQDQEDKERAAAERRNAAFFREQAEFARRAGEREQAIFKRQSQHFIDEQISTISKSGVNFSGSFVNVVAESQFLANQELQAIREATDFNVRLAEMRGLDSLDTARAIEGGRQRRFVGNVIGGAANALVLARKGGGRDVGGGGGGNTPDGGFSGPMPASTYFDNTIA